MPIPYFWVEVIRVDSRVESLELSGRREALKPTRFAPVVNGEPQRHGANLRVSKAWEVILVGSHAVLLLLRV